MSNRSLVSTIIIFLNAEKYVEEAIESVFAQTYENWELLLVDDGSTDASTAIARRYGLQYSERVRYLQHPGFRNQGMSASRNLGIRHAQGEYLAFLDADDVWLPHKLERQVAMLNSQPEAGMLYGNTQYWHSWTGLDEDSERDHVPELGIQPNTLIHPPRLLTLFLEGKAAVPCSCSILVRRDTLESVDGFEESFHSMYEDQAFYAKICLNKPVFVCGESLEKYRQHRQSTCYIAASEGCSSKARLNFLAWLAQYMSKHSVTDGEVWQALNRDLWLHSCPAWLRSSARTSFILRWAKKWALVLEEWTLPTPIRRWLWS